MKWKKSRKINITSRDIDLLKLLFEYKVLDREAAEHFIFTGRDPNVARRRLKRLIECNLIRIIPNIGARKINIAYTLTPKGLEKIIPSLPFFPDRKETGSASIGHDLELVRIGEKFKSSSFVTEYRTENILQSSGYFREEMRYRPFCQLHSDAFAAITIQEREYLVAIEFEATAKSDERWEQKLYDYHMEEGINAIIYICEGENLRARMKKLEIKLCHRFDPKMYTTNRTDFLSSGKSAVFNNVFGQEFILDFSK